MHDRQRGFSLVEILAAVIIMSVVTAAVMQVLQNLRQGSHYSQAGMSLAGTGQAAVNRVGKDVAAAKRFFGRAPGAPYLAMLDLSATPYPPLNGSRLPVVQQNLSFSAAQYGYTTAPFLPDDVGNSLLLAAYDAPFSCTGGGFTRLLNSFRFHYYYLTRRPLPQGLLHLGQAYSLDLAGWHGAPLLDYLQLAALLADYPTQGSAILQTLANAGFDRAWNYLTIDPTRAIFSFDIPNGALVPVAAPTLPATRYESVTRLSGPHGDLIVGVAPNQPGSDTSTPLDRRVPAFALPDGTGDGFPHGFEVMIGGGSGGRRVMLRLVQVATGGPTQYFKATVSVFAGREG